MRRWQITGIIATLVILLALPIYVLTRSKPTTLEQKEKSPAFVTSGACQECHKKEYELWQKSHHALSMAVAGDETVQGDFADAVLEHQGVTSRFYRKDGRFFVHTRGPDGTMGDFEITHTFGWFPLQQYLVPFPGGRLQCLPIAWDSRENKWFHLYPDLDLDPKEWIYWTNQGQNWNSMCADCHSTELKKNFNPQTNTYATSWAEINVGCEACHGPGSEHVKWGKLPEMARRLSGNGLTVQSAKSNRQQVENCAPCHSRRSMLGDYVPQGQHLLDVEVPRLLKQGLYYPDGQILDEVYVYGSFVQSKMYANGVRCSDCHDPHSITLHEKGNALCLQCHQAARYDRKAHHFHKKKGEGGEPIRSPEGTILFAVGTGTECVQCHMPGRIYMGNDYRPDHSIRVPRPDLSMEINVPNACNRCHADKDAAWSASYTKKWYGEKRNYNFGPTFAGGRKAEPGAEPKLNSIAADHLSPVLVRATALSLLGRYRAEDVLPAFRKALQYEEAILRRAALVYLPRIAPDELVKLASPYLQDPVKGVRIEAARALTALPADMIPERYEKQYTRALAEFRQTALYSADFAASRLNLGALAMHEGKIDEAEEQFKQAVAIDPDFMSARSNLAVLYSRQGKNDLAEQQLREALARNPNLGNINYSLGLLLSEEKRYTEAVDHLARAAAAMPINARVHYNLGQLLVFLGRAGEAEQALQQAVQLDPENIQYMVPLAQLYLQQRRLQEASNLAEKMRATNPDNPLGQQLLDFIQQQDIEPR